MENIYNKSDLDRNSEQSVPEGYRSASYLQLMKWLGGFWRNVHTGTDFVKGIQGARSMALAQFYLDMLEGLKLQDRKGAPVFHREMWKPLVIRKGSEGKGAENILKLGKNSAVMGAQPEGGMYISESLRIGRMAEFADYVTYPVSGGISSIVSGICDNPINPTVSWKAGSDFSYENGTIVIPRSKDPFRPGSEFVSYDVADDSGDDIETVLWASDVLIDKGYIPDHIGYALGIDPESSDVAKRILNAGWDSLTGGLTPQAMRTLIAAMLNVPVIQDESEKVLSIDSDESGTTVRTDRNEYTVSPSAELSGSVSVGSVMHRGDFLDTTARVYPLMNSFDAERLASASLGVSGFREDVPVIDVPASIVRADTHGGICVTWDKVPVTSAGTDSNGNEMPWFKLGGSEDDVSSFWADAWDYAERNGIDLMRMVRESASGASSDSSDGSSSSGILEISPAEFFIKYLIGANTIIVTVDAASADDTRMIRDPMFFGLLRNAVPSGMRLFFIEHLQAGDGGDAYDMGSGRTEDAASVLAAETADDEDDAFYEYGNAPGMSASYSDSVSSKLVRRCRRDYGEREGYPGMSE